MKRSLNEIAGTVLKAGRGAGLPLGHCESLGRAAAYLAAIDPLRLDCLPRVLTGPYDLNQITWDADHCEIVQARAAMAGPIAVDAIAAGCEQVRLRDLDAPRIVLAFFAVRGVSITHQMLGDDLIVRKAETPVLPVPNAAEVTVSDQLWNALCALAAKTYVPASEASRLAGAGAGLTDND